MKFMKFSTLLLLGFEESEQIYIYTVPGFGIWIFFSQSRKTKVGQSAVQRSWAKHFGWYILRGIEKKRFYFGHGHMLFPPPEIPGSTPLSFLVALGLSRGHD